VLRALTHALVVFALAAQTVTAGCSALRCGTSAAISSCCCKHPNASGEQARVGRDCACELRQAAETPGPAPSAPLATRDIGREAAPLTLAPSWELIGRDTAVDVTPVRRDSGPPSLIPLYLQQRQLLL
jgi:hypothetical protein